MEERTREQSLEHLEDSGGSRIVAGLASLGTANGVMSPGCSQSAK